jgi:hypothetical protein
VDSESAGKHLSDVVGAVERLVCDGDHGSSGSLAARRLFDDGSFREAGDMRPTA